MIAQMTADIGRRVADARTARDWTQTDLARRSGVSASYISRLEDGVYKRPSHDHLSAIARALGRPVADLTDPSPPQTDDSELRRTLVEQFGPDRADLVHTILEKMRGRSLEDLETAVRVTRALLD